MDKPQEKQQSEFYDMVPIPWNTPQLLLMIIDELGTIARASSWVPEVAASIVTQKCFTAEVNLMVMSTKN